MISRYGAIGMSTVSAEFFIENSTKIHNQLFHDIQKKFKVDDSIHSFQELVTLRRNELLQVYPDLNNGNLAAIFESSQSIHYIQLHAIKSINSYWHQLEKIAIELFGSLLACWGYYERFCILEKYQAMPISIFNDIPYDESQYQSEIVEDIQLDSRKFYTLYSNVPLSLSDANALININNLIIEQKWYEILFSILLSQKSRHFILYHKDKFNRLVLTSASLIQSWETKDSWLSFEAFFQGEDWKPCMTKNARFQLYQLGIFRDSILDENTSLWIKEALDSYVKSPSEVCEILRFSVCGSPYFRLFLLYFAHKELMKRLVESNFYVSYMITDQPFFINFYQSANDTCYIIDSYRSINGSSYNTFKGFLIHKRAFDKFTKSTYKKFRLTTLRTAQKNND